MSAPARKTHTQPIQPHVVDLFHGDLCSDFQAARMYAGLFGVIHKASQGASNQDPSYATRRTRAVSAGLLWGAYHFLDNSAIDLQVDNFLRSAKPDEATLVAVDYEPNDVKSRTPGLAHLEEFCEEIEKALGRKMVIYSGSLLKETLGDKTDAYLGSHRLWLAEYSSAPKLEPLKAWKAPWLWQYTDGSHDAPKIYPHVVRGVEGSQGELDCNYYAGPIAQLAAEWAS